MLHTEKIATIICALALLWPTPGLTHGSSGMESLKKSHCADFPGAYEVAIDTISVPQYQDRDKWKFHVRFRTEQHFYSFYKKNDEHAVAVMIARAEQDGVLFRNVVWEEGDSIFSVRFIDEVSGLLPISPVCVNPIKYHRDTRFDLNHLLNIFLEKNIAREIQWHE